MSIAIVALRSSSVRNISESVMDFIWFATAIETMTIARPKAIRSMYSVDVCPRFPRRLNNPDHSEIAVEAGLIAF